MRLHIFGLAAGVLALAPGVAMAATISTGTQSSSGSVSLDQFDPSLGTLTAVTGIFSGSETATVSTDAQSYMPSVSYSLNGFYSAYLAGSTFDFHITGSGTTEAGPLGPSTVMGAGDNGPSGQTKTDSALLTALTGTGSVSAYTVADPPSVTFSDGVHQTAGNNMVTSHFTNYELIYTYTPFDSGVPEPASWATMLSGFGLVGGAMRRRPRMSTAA